MGGSSIGHYVFMTIGFQSFLFSVSSSKTFIAFSAGLESMLILMFIEDRSF